MDQYQSHEGNLGPPYRDPVDLPIELFEEIFSHFNIHELT